MSQTGDYNIANASGSTVRQDLTDTFQNVLSSNSGGAVPGYAVAGTLYYSTNAEQPYIYFYDGSAWHPIIKINGNGFFSATDASTSVEINTTGSIELHSGLAANATPFIDFKRGAVDVECRITQSADGNYDLVMQTGGSVSAFKSFQFKGNGTLIFPGATSGGLAHEGVTCARGYGCRTGLATDSGNIINGVVQTSINTSNVFNFWWDPTNSDAYFYIDNTRLGHIDASTTSDYRIKREITTLDVNGIDRVKQLRPVSYKYTDYEIFKSSEVVHEGFIAHEVGEVIADACKGEKDKHLQSIGLAPLVATLTKALQEAVAKIETLETKVAALEAK
jgi:hypothetical protein